MLYNTFCVLLNFADIKNEFFPWLLLSRIFYTFFRKYHLAISIKNLIGKAYEERNS